jgi:quinol monooxygenase YgiN/uncharacterized protein YunC (DUF1805 family)
MQTLIVTFVAKPGCEQALETAINELQRATVLEPGAISYELHRGAAGSRTVHLYERYADTTAMKTHLASVYLQAALPKLAQLLAQPHTMIECDYRSGLHPRTLEIEGKRVTLHSIPLGPANLVFVQTQRGILACGAIDPAALQRFGLPTARVKPTCGPLIANLDDLLAGEVREANEAAGALGVRIGMTGREALRLV